MGLRHPQIIGDLKKLSAKLSISKLTAKLSQKKLLSERMGYRTPLVLMLLHNISQLQRLWLLMLLRHFGVSPKFQPDIKTTLKGSTNVVKYVHLLSLQICIRLHKSRYRFLLLWDNPITQLMCHISWITRTSKMQSTQT